MVSGVASKKGDRVMAFTNGYCQTHPVTAVYPDIWQQWAGSDQGTESCSTTACSTTAWTQWATTDTETDDNSVYRYWVNQPTSVTATITTDATWGYWIHGQNQQSIRPMQLEPVLRTPEELAEQARHFEAARVASELARVGAIERYNLEQAERMEKQNAAKVKAEALLLAHLTEEQERAWREERAIFVTGQSGKRYKIKEGRTHNLFEVDEAGQAIVKFCVHVEAQCPDADNVLAQKLALQYNEVALMQRANRSALGVAGRHP